MSPQNGVLLTKPLAQFMAGLFGVSIPPTMLDKKGRKVNRAPGAQLCYVQMVAPEYGSDLNAVVLLSVCGYNPGDRLLVESQAGISVPGEGQLLWVIRVFDPTEEVDGEHCPPHWVPVIVEAAGGSVWFEVVEVQTDGSVLADWTDFNGGCATPPGVDDYTGYITVHDRCVFNSYAASALLGQTGHATWMTARAGCEARWLVDWMCPIPECS